MKIVCDTSVLIAAHIARAGTCSELLRTVIDEHDLIVSEFILNEFSEKLVEKFKFKEQVAQTLKNRLRQAAIVVNPEDVPEGSCRDNEDLPILGTAAASSADMLVSVDKDLLDLASFKPTKILRPGDFFRALRS